MSAGMVILPRDSVFQKEIQRNKPASSKRPVFFATAGERGIVRVRSEVAVSSLMSVYRDAGMQLGMPGAGAAPEAASCTCSVLARCEVHVVPRHGGLAHPLSFQSVAGSPTDAAHPQS